MFPKIADSEWLIMKVLWKRSPKTANEIITSLADAVQWNPKTVKTLLNRLVNKKVLGFTKEGRTYHYFPLVSEKKCANAERQSFISKVYSGALQPMLAAFLEDGKLSDNEIDELKKILEKKEGISNDDDN